MPRRLKAQTAELGFVELFLIYEVDGVWEDEWKPLQGADITSLLTVVPKETMDHLLKGWSKPLINALRISPEGALRKVPEQARVCMHRAACPYFDKATCYPLAKKMPWCFEPDGLASSEASRLASELIKFWREGVYVVVVQEESDAGRSDRRP